MKAIPQSSPFLCGMVTIPKSVVFHIGLPTLEEIMIKKNLG